MNKAERILEYYESEDFQSNYIPLLFEDLSSNERQIAINLQNIIKYDLEFNDILPNKYLETKTCLKIVNLCEKYMQDDLDSLISTFSNYYVGDSCLVSCSYGEQEEQLEENESQIFDDAGFYVSDRNYAYYDLSGEGIMIDFYRFFNLPNFLEDFTALYQS